MSFENFPYTNFHDLNLDWIIKKLKECYSPDNPPESVVMSVNGESGVVVLYTNAIVRLPDVENSSWNIHRLADGSSEGIEFTKNQPAKRINGTNRYEMYDAGNPPPYPVRSVNGQTGNVVVSVPVQSVNGQTGVITLYQNAQIAFPNVEAETWNMYRGTGENGTITGIQFTTGEKATRIDGTHRYDIYDEGNPPPYPVTSVGTLTGAVAILDTSIVTDGGTQKIKIAFPVTSVDGATGAVTTWGASGNGILQPPVAAEGDVWGFKREIISGDIGITFEYDEINDTPAGYIVFNDGTNPQVKLKILTPDNIPSSSGVVSFNGQTGVITCTGANLAVSGDDATKIDVALTSKAMANELDIVIYGDSSTVNITAGQFVSVRNSTITGITDGIYKAANNISANTSINSSDLIAITSGALNELINQIDTVSGKVGAAYTTIVSGFILRRFGQVVYCTCYSGTYYKNSSGHITTGSATGTECAIPSGFTPVANCEIACVNPSFMRITAKTSGYFDVSEAISGSALRFSACWITTDAMPT